MKAKSTETLFHTLSGKSVVERDDARYKEYRRQWNENPKRFVVSDFPLHLDIEPTASCNLRCSFCATTYNPYKKGFMKEDTWKMILNEAGRAGLYSLKFTYRGEPLLHKDIIRMVDYAKQVGVMDVYFNTNATLLTEKRIRGLIDAGLDRISISFEGCDKETYERMRVGANFEKTIKNILKLKEIKEELGTKKPLTRIQTVLAPEVDKTEYIEFWKDKADEVAYLEMKNEKENPDHTGRVCDWACSMLWQRLTVTWEGTILPCVHDIYEQMPLGDIGVTTIRDAWHSFDEENYRAYHESGQAHCVVACDRCPLRAMEIDKLGAC